MPRLFRQTLWFDVGIKRYTTAGSRADTYLPLWFDVGIKRYTTTRCITHIDHWLWFDVGIKRYTTSVRWLRKAVGCGLM